MPTFEVTSPDGKTTLEITGDRVPTEEELKMIFASMVAPETTMTTPVSPSTGEKVMEYARPALQTAGLIGGGAVGAPLGPAAAVAGGGLGYAMANKVSDLGDQYIAGKPPQPRGLGQQLVGAGEDVARGATEYMMGENIGKAVTGIGQKVIAPYMKRLTNEPLKPGGLRPVKPEVEELKGIYKEFGITPNPTEIVKDSKTLSILEGLLGYSPISGDIFLRRMYDRIAVMNRTRMQLLEQAGPKEQIEMLGLEIKKEATKLLEKYGNFKGQQLEGLVNKFMSQLGEGATTKYGAGVEFQTILSENLAKRNKKISNLYDEVDNILGDTTRTNVPLSQETMQTADKLFAQEMSKPKAYRNSKVLERIRPFLSDTTMVGLSDADRAYLAASPALKEAYLAQVSKETGYSWEGMKQTRSQLLADVEEIKKVKGLNTPESRVYGKLADAIETDMSQAAEQIGGDVWSKYAKARSASKQMHDIFDKDLLKIMKQSPEKVVDRIIRNNEISLIDKIKTEFGQEGIDALNSAYFKRVFEKSVDKSGMISTAKIRSSLTGLGDEALQKTLTKDQRYSLDAMLKNVDEINSMFGKKGRSETIRFLEAITGKLNENVLSFIVKPENITNIKLAKKLLPPDKIKEISRLALENVLKVGELADNYLPVQSANQWGKYRSVLDELLPADLKKAAENFVKMGGNAKRVEALAQNASQTGQVVVGYRTAQELLKFSQDQFVIFKVLGVPWLVSKIYTSRAATQYFTSALQLPPSSPKAIANFIKAYRIATEQEPIEEQIKSGLGFPKRNLNGLGAGVK